MVWLWHLRVPDCTSRQDGPEPSARSARNNLPCFPGMGYLLPGSGHTTRTQDVADKVLTGFASDCTDGHVSDQGCRDTEGDRWREADFVVQITCPRSRFYGNLPKT
jgi:hypothetical protein